MLTPLIAKEATTSAAYATKKGTKTWKIIKVSKTSPSQQNKYGTQAAALSENVLKKTFSIHYNTKAVFTQLILKCTKSMVLIHHVVMFNPV